MSMTIEEISTSVTMALCKSVVTKDEKLVKTIENDVEDQCTIIGEHLALKFKLICMKDAEECMTNKKKMAELFKKFELVGPRYSTEIKDSEMEFLLTEGLILKKNHIHLEIYKYSEVCQNLLTKVKQILIIIHLEIREKLNQ